MAKADTDPQTQLEEEVMDDPDMEQKLLRHLGLKAQAGAYTKSQKDLKEQFPRKDYAGRRLRYGVVVLDFTLGEPGESKVEFTRGPQYRINVKNTSEA